ncbi:MAG TPA: protein-glutamate O-methyltransferase CheR [Gemmatimonadaceae bacterium]
MSPETRVAQSRAVNVNWRFREPSDAEFRRFTATVYAAAGISLNDSKRALVARRLNSRMRDLGLETLNDYVDFVEADKVGEEMVILLDLIATNETHFFREQQHFEYLESHVFPRWRVEAAAGERAKQVRVWSAACSTGQEPYSIGMLLLNHFPASEGWSIDLHASDISTQALDVARRGEWPVEKAKEIPEELLERFMLRGVGSSIGRMRSVRELRDLIRFSRINLNEPTYDVPGQFDLVFCRNVLIYFSAEGRAAVIERLTGRLNKSGLLFVGHAESLHQHRTRLRAVLPTVYALAA